MQPIQPTILTLPQRWESPSLLTMWDANMPRLPDEIWMHIFSFCPFAKLSGLSVVNKSWYVITKDTQNEFLKSSAKILYTCCRKLFLKWKKVEETQNKPVNWIVILTSQFREKQKEMRILKREIYVWKKEVENFPYVIDENDPIFAIKNYLLVPPNPQTSKIGCTISLFGDTKAHRVKFSSEACRVDKISENQFAIIEKDKNQRLAAIKIWSFISEKETPICKVEKHNFLTDCDPIFFKNSFVIFSLDENKGNTVCHLTASIFSLFGKLRGTVKFPPLDNPYFRFEALTEDYLILSKMDQTHNKCTTIFDRKSGQFLNTIPYEYLNNEDNILLFTDSQRKQILTFDFENSAIEPALILNLENICLASHMTETHCYFVDRAFLYIYSYAQKKGEKLSLLGPNADYTIYSCQIIRATQNVIMLSFITFTQDRGSLFELRIYTRNSDQFFLNSFYGDYIFFNENYFFIVNDVNDEKFEIPYKITTYLYGNPNNTPTQLHFTNEIRFIADEENKREDTFSKNLY